MRLDKQIQQNLSIASHASDKKIINWLKGILGGAREHSKKSK